MIASFKGEAPITAFEYDIVKRSIIDHSGKVQSAVDWLTTSLGTALPPKKSARRSKSHMHSVPWKHDFKNNCVKCNRAYHLQKHHIVYNPALIVFLCETCHSRVTGLNSRAAVVADTSLYHKPIYTNKIRVILWRWFLANPWPVDKSNKPVKRLSKTSVRNILSKHELNLLKQNVGTAGEQPKRSQARPALTLSSNITG